MTIFCILSLLRPGDGALRSLLIINTVQAKKLRSSNLAEFVLLMPLRRGGLENGGVGPDGSEEVALRAMTNKLAFPHPALFDEMKESRPVLRTLGPDDRQRKFTK